MSRIIPPPQVKGKSIIEVTAIEMCAEFYDVAMRQGLPTTYKTQRKYVKANWEKFIPVALNALLEILGGDYPEEMKKPIYAAVIERANSQPALNIANPFR